jgi:2-polyprenyl-3-methyl-5-hydroxy-6-metoxy-1,4-benzoquinol methylase
MLVERMDEADCDPEKLQRTYAQFTQINRLLSEWGSLYKKHLRPALQAGASTILDIGCGGGDVIRLLAHYAHRDGFSPTFLGIDPDPRAIAFAQAQSNISNTCFAQVDLAQITEKYDILLSNHVLHHLKDAEIAPFCLACQRVATRQIVHNDICRDDLALALFPLVGGWFRGSYILEDGRRSIRRAFVPRELEAIIPAGWHVEKSSPFRLQLLWNT